VEPKWLLKVKQKYGFYLLSHEEGRTCAVRGLIPEILKCCTVSGIVVTGEKGPGSVAVQWNQILSFKKFSIP
jgi:hypothetical protein